jgi:hypothetical protein
MSGGKGGTQTTEVKIPEWLEAAARENLARGQAVANIGYTPYYGPDVAAMTPMQLAAIQGTSSAAGAFGLPGGGMTGMEGMPTPQTFAGGVQGYSSGGLYDQALAELQTRRPGQYNAITGMFVDPITGAAPVSTFDPIATLPVLPTPAIPPANGQRDDRGRDGDRGMSRSTNANDGGFTSVRDMFDGGGPGRSGTTFSGGPLSGAANRAGIGPIGRDGGGGMGRGK